MAETLKHYRLVTADGSIQYRTVAAGALPPRWERGAPRPVQVPRLPGDFEDWDEALGRFVVNEALRADAVAGPEAIARAHAQKAIEALLIKAGVAIEGMLACEASALGIALDDLADQVAAKTRDEIEAEVLRRVVKKGTK